MSASPRDQRLDMRLPAAQKALIERAAAVSGKTLSAFAVDALVHRAEEVIAAHETTTLSVRDWEVFHRVLDDDRPNAALVAAARRHIRG